MPRARTVPSDRVVVGRAPASGPAWRRRGSAISRRRRWWAAIVVPSLLLVACGGDGPVDDRLVAESMDDEFAPEGCGTVAGAADDLAAEPKDWLDRQEYVRWEDTDGCPVRVDVVANVHGDAACGWESAQFITIGDPPGTPFTDEADARRFYWDPDGVLGEVAPPTGFTERDLLPPTAHDVGFRLDGLELWVDSADPDLMYRVGGDRVEVWSRDIDDTIHCA